MATKVYFISEGYFKENSVVNLNVEPQLINLAIQDSQMLHLQSTLGSKLYSKMSALITTGDISKPENADYKALLDDHVVDAVMYWALVEVLPYIRYKIMNKSVSGQNSENSEPVDSKDLKYLQESFRNKAEFASQRLADHLLANCSTYPEYRGATAIDDMLPSSNSYFSGMVIDDVDDAKNARRILGINNASELNW